MNRSIIVYAALLVGSLGFAYQTWTHQDELALADKVVVLPGKPEQLASIIYRTPDFDLELRFDEDDLGRYAWGSTTPHEKADEPEAPPTEGQPPPPAVPSSPEQFKVGKAGRVVFESLAPFVAKRKLEGVTEADLEAFGLVDPESSLEITREGKEAKAYEVGSQVFGGANVYVRDPADGSIYLVEAKVLRPLSMGSRTLQERDLTGIDERKVERVELRVDDRQAAFAQHNPDDAEAKYWSIAGDEERSAEATSWVGKVLRLRSLRYVQPDATPAGLAPAFSFVVHPEDGDSIQVDVSRAFDEEGQEQFYARSAYTRGLVHLPKVAAAEASADLDSALVAAGS